TPVAVLLSVHGGCGPERGARHGAVRPGTRKRPDLPALLRAGARLCGHIPAPGARTRPPARYRGPLRPPVCALQPDVVSRGLARGRPDSAEKARLGKD